MEVDVQTIGTDARATGTGPNGEDVVVQGALPGERVSVDIVHTSKKGRHFGVVQDVLQPSPDRVASKCDHFLTCGGCDLLHANMDFQHQLKRRIVAEALDMAVDDVDPVVAAPRSLGYRALAKGVVGPNGIIGSYRPRSHDVVDMQGCVVHAPEAEVVLDAVRAFLQSAQVDLRYVLVRASIISRKSIVTLVARSEDATGIRDLAGQLAKREDVSRVVLNVNDLDTDALLAPGRDVILESGPAPVERVGEAEQSLEAGAFVQVNPMAAGALYGLVVRDIETGEGTILDLYSGSGGIALTLGKAGASRVHGIEAHASAVRAAIDAAARMGLSDRVTFESAPVESGLERAPEASAIVLNPPRRGASRQVLEAIAARAPLRLVYVSCNPKSLARDVAILKSLAHFEVERVRPVDMFPQTRHVETVLCGRLEVLR